MTPSVSLDDFDSPSPSLATAARGDGAAHDRHREMMDRLNAQIEDLAREPSPSTLIAACVVVRAQPALQHAVELIALWPGYPESSAVLRPSGRR
ncbi:hypothetical protein [Nonomuraea jiangxiensis]|uniref:Uncharacterized protein n=1 Tax=Nonomuraea jiangxiensis TaxID=633440 RepID=A0A1G9I0R1_9ACTN|nr:hypothetical protein [Nonomuraea jiangxiensis]SDL18413.1 hypothetical protein SAMN05421869_12335 [Nonomuraea jiangxiensis]